MTEKYDRYLLVCLLFSGFICCLPCQSTYTFNEERATEDYSFLKDSTNLTWQESAKFIPLNSRRNSYLSLGGSYRGRFEHYTDRSWIAGNNENYYTQRLSFHTDWHLGNYFSVFVELYHGYESRDEVIPQHDDLDWHQGFVEINLPIKANHLILKFGRQELKFGGGRLVDLRAGTNIRRSFDSGNITFKSRSLNLYGFYGKEVQIGFDVFDNDFNFFNKEQLSPKLWGIYSQFKVFPNDSKEKDMELYYIGAQFNQSAFSDVIGREMRHSIGIRSFGKIQKKFQYNSEFIYQFGDIGGRSISAFNFETDWKYTLSQKSWRPTLGLKLDWSSGDRKTNDNKLNSFNPLFVNPGIYSLAGVNTPINLLSLHPSFIFFPIKKWMVNIEFATFFRAVKNDGFYSPPGFLTRPANGFSERHLGNTIGLSLKYTHNRHLSFDIRSSYFFAGDFIEISGDAENLFQFAPTISLQF
ncbi:MAG: alginate export family protein [Bacteroidota bacterium]